MESFLFFLVFPDHNSGSRSESFWETFRVSVAILALEMVVARCILELLE